jgi:ribonuclease T
MISRRFRGFLPVVVDVETSGVKPEIHAVLEIAVVFLQLKGREWGLGERYSFHLLPFEGAVIDPKSMEVNGIRLDHPFRFARPESEVLPEFFDLVKQEVQNQQCTKAILVGHNAFFDLAFINAAAARTQCKSPFHSFSQFDTVSLAGLMFGQTVLARALHAAGLEWNSEEAHSALYDAEKTAELFCLILNRFDARRFRYHEL